MIADNPAAPSDAECDVIRRAMPPIDYRQPYAWSDALIRAGAAWQAARASAQEPVARGYARLGIGAYLINHSRAGEPPELVISLATEAEKAGRVVGDERDNEPDSVVLPEDMVVRIGFENEAGLGALEAQLRHVRDVHFAAPPAAPVEPPAQDAEGALRELVAALEAEAKAKMSSDNARDNFADAGPEHRRYGAALLRTAEAHNAARAALSDMDKGRG